MLNVVVGSVLTLQGVQNRDVGNAVMVEVARHRGSQVGGVFDAVLARLVACYEFID